MRIWKWPLRATDVQTLMLPGHAELLTVGVQEGRAQLWALFDDLYASAIEPRTIAIYGTGHDIPEHPGKYIGTFNVDTGSWRLVFHVFEQIKQEGVSL